MKNCKRAVENYCRKMKQDFTWNWKQTIGNVYLFLCTNHTFDKDTRFDHVYPSEFAFERLCIFTRWAPDKTSIYPAIWWLKKYVTNIVTRLITKYGESPNRSPNMSQNLSPNTLGILYVQTGSFLVITKIRALDGYISTNARLDGRTRL